MKDKKPEILRPEDRKKRRRREIWILAVLFLILTAAGIGSALLYQRAVEQRGHKQPISIQIEETQSETETEEETESENEVRVPMPEIDIQLLTVNEHSRPGEKTDPITAVVIHYVGNPGATAQEERDYFESLKDLNTAEVSSNFVIGLEGEIIECVPPSEIACASNSRNHDTISIENCHRDATGEFEEATCQSLIELTAYLCDVYELDPLDGGVIRHYDVTGKECPLYYVEHEDEWETLKQDVAEYMREYGAY